METYTIYIAIIAFSVSFIGSSVAIGSGVLLASSLALLYPAKEAVIIGAPIIVMADVFALMFYWRHRASTQFIVKVIIACIPGLLLGIALLPIISAEIFKFCLGVFGMSYTLGMTFPNFPPTQGFKKVFRKIEENYKNIELYFFGTLTGLASIFAHACGLVLSVFLQNKIHDKRIFTGTLIILYLFTDTLKTVVYIYTDLLAIDTILNLLYLSPFMLLGSYLGNALNNRISTKNFKALVLIIIFLASLNLCL